MKYQSNMGERYSPLYFLSALGAGGLSVSFFMYIMWMTPHKGSPIPTFSSLIEVLTTGSLAMQALTAISVIGIAVFAVLHVRLLIWNLKEYNIWKKTQAYQTLKSSNGESLLMAMPLTLAMSINVSFIVGAVFVPGLWSIREILFPLALIGFGAVGYLGLRIYLDFISRILTKGGYECAKNNSLGQMVSVFAFSMIGVGFSASAAMSYIKVTSVLGYIGAVFFVSAAIILGFMKLILGFRAMMEHKAAGETTPTLWIVIPILTVLGIALYRMKMAMMHNFDSPSTNGEIFAFLITIFAIQLLFGLIGWAVMKRVGYFERWISGPEKSPGSFALICPGVALFVFGNFVINAGLVRIEVLDKFSIGYFALYVPLIVIQLLTVRLFVRLTGKLVKEDKPLQAQPAE